MAEDPRIEQIRAVLAYVDEHEMPSPYTALRRIREIVDQPPPRPQTLSDVTCPNCGCCTAELCDYAKQLDVSCAACVTNSVDVRECPCMPLFPPREVPHG